MFTFLTGSRRGRKANGSRILSPFRGSPETSRHRQRGQIEDGSDIDENEDEDEEDEDADEFSPLQRPTSFFSRSRAERLDQDAADPEDDDDDAEADGEDEDGDAPLLPIFSAAHLDKLPLYNVTHAIRLLVVQRCETTLSWDQLRSPQISQFLVKPIQGQIRTSHFNRATLCALIANCLQFQKEAQLHPGNVGVLNTRALICELLAMRLVKEFTTRELIDALSYEFDPLQGMSPPTTAEGQRNNRWTMQYDPQSRRTQGKGARVSTIEIAIRAQTKRFLSHQLVVQHLEAIWAGTIVFHSEADNLHRRTQSIVEEPSRNRTYGTIDDTAAEPDATRSGKANAATTKKWTPTDVKHARRTVTLYNPRDASLLKLSRLRVPRYRQMFSTVSFAIMLALFLLVLNGRSLYITPLEVVFWFWSVGYMLDEVVGFSEQGFGLYMLSFWNAFDLGILLLFVVYYCLRLYGIILAEDSKRFIANAAFDVLASTAILLFPRLFSVLDHYRYFSQLLIAFRMMAQDLMAILVLILISCSGFFVAFTLSFASAQTDGRGVAYQLFQIVMGFTPAAWDHWQEYNLLGKILLTAFLIICHFVIVTILITVLTNSFMAIVKNAHEEHQFLFAINTISMVKSDALFSYIAPTNVVGWLLSPLRFVIPFRQFVKVNRTVIKVTHFPVLFVIFGYERLIMSKAAYEPMELVEKRPKRQHQPIAFTVHQAPDAFGAGHRLLREPSMISFNKDRALDEVFRRPFRGSTVRTTPRHIGGEQRKSANVVDKWMQVAENEGGASPPLEQPRSVVDRLENRRPSFRRSSTVEHDRKNLKKGRDFSSDPDVTSTINLGRPFRIDEESHLRVPSQDALRQDTDADGDDENNLDSDIAGPAIGESAVSVYDKENRTPLHEIDDDDDDELFPTPTGDKSPLMQRSAETRALLQQTHTRKVSTDTALFAPRRSPAIEVPGRFLKGRSPPRNTTLQLRDTRNLAPVDLPSGQHTPKLKPPKARPVHPPRQKTAPNFVSTVGLSFLDMDRRQPSFNARALDLASDIGDNKWVQGGPGIDAGGISGMSNSFSEQIFRENERKRRQEEHRRRTAEEEKGMVNRIMLARMNTLEQGFREVVKEIKGLSHSTANNSASGSRIESEVEGMMPSAASGASPREGKGKSRLRKGAQGEKVVAVGDGQAVSQDRVKATEVGDVLLDGSGTAHDA